MQKEDDTDDLVRIQKNAGLGVGGKIMQTTNGLSQSNNLNLAMPNVRANAAQAMKRKPAGQSQPVVH